MERTQSWHKSISVKANRFGQDKADYFKGIQRRIYAETFSAFPSTSGKVFGAGLILAMGFDCAMKGTGTVLTDWKKVAEFIGGEILLFGMDLYFVHSRKKDEIERKTLSEGQYERQWEKDFDRKTVWPAFLKYVETHEYVKQFRCPHSKKLMRCAVIAPDKKVYDLLSVSNFLRSYNKGKKTYSISCESLEHLDPFPLNDCVPAYCTQLRLYRCLVDFIDLKVLKEDQLHKRVRSSLERIKGRLESAIATLYARAIVGQMEGQRGSTYRGRGARSKKRYIEGEFVKWADHCDKDKPRYYPKGYAQQLLATWRIVRKESPEEESD